MDTHFGSFRDVSFPPFFFFFLNRCTYEFANFYVIYIYINNCVCFVCMCLCTVCMTFFMQCLVCNSCVCPVARFLY